MADKTEKSKRPKLTYTNDQNMLLGFLAHTVMTREWFSGILVPTPDLVMSRLLMLIYIHQVTGTVLSKKEASSQIGVSDIKTARKYILKAEELELIEILPSKTDKRVELLHPTELLKHCIERELHDFASLLRRAMHSIVFMPLPKTGDPNLLPGERFWGGNIGFDQKTHDAILEEMMAKVSIPRALQAAARLNKKRESSSWWKPLFMSRTKKAPQ